MTGVDMFRMEYRELNDKEKLVIADAKGKACGLYATFEMEVEGADPRCQALAKTKLEEAIMWYVKSVTGESTIK